LKWALLALIFWLTGGRTSSLRSTVKLNWSGFLGFRPPRRWFLIFPTKSSSPAPAPRIHLRPSCPQFSIDSWQNKLRGTPTPVEAVSLGHVRYSPSECKVWTTFPILICCRTTSTKAQSGWPNNAGVWCSINDPDLIWYHAQSAFFAAQDTSIRMTFFFTVRRAPVNPWWTNTLVRGWF